MNIIKLVVLSVILAFFTTSIYAKEVQYLGLFTAKEKSYTVGKGKDAVVIKRVMTSCAKNKGWFQDFVPVKGVTPVTEADLLRALNDKNSIVVDMRMQDQYLKETIPTSINIPFGEMELRMDELGCKKDGDKWDCSDTPNVYGFCNGPVCPQSPYSYEGTC
ncbi:MAG: sulfurtransferase [Sulfurimonas sp.]|nr:MAG: sulfurtransferase [Sulfurimonas sp.]